MLLRPTLRLALAAVLLVAPGKALRPPSTAHAGGRPAAGLGRRQAVLGGAAAALLSGGAAPAFAEKKKDYMTMSEYQELKQKEKKDEDTFGKFEALSTRASQTAEFDSLAAKGDFGKVTELARAWDATVRKEVLEKASETLKGDDKAKGEGLNKAVLADLKTLDKFAKAKDVDAIKATTAELKGHVEAFVALLPERLANKYGSLGGVGDL